MPYREPTRRELAEEEPLSRNRIARTARTRVFSSPPKSNERATQRFDVRLVASVELAASTYIGFAENFSRGGVFIVTPAPKKVGTVVNLVIALPDLVLVRVQGTVRWVRQASTAEGTAAGMGIRFERFSALDGVRIHEFTKARQGRYVENAGLRSA